MVDLDVHNLVAWEITHDELPCHLGHAHELVGATHKQVDTVAVELVQVGPEL